ncbi:NGG1p interacting factor NIF3 [Rudanella paleaurantiibacter]|uniref:NGG1p interacting factor NIF3 n=1 Tax=Rudanella paleaurantiibacter TaxID=2614655 RepID=A0A7J5U4A3_9BACT|nr:Nif3-like dinuclear metal center hexameric protein [Rudanella paleaurantiibacter]KAB7732561.1 NGG1p interacting factor NIF3 [Rudanella paleaurantiibacter]
MANRRQFIAGLSQTLGAAYLLNIPFCAGATPVASAPLTVGQVMELILKTIPGAPFPKTVDTLKSGRPEQPVTGIISTMFTTIEVIEQAIAAGANFIIAHEPTFYNHADETDWLKDSPVLQHKQALLDKHKIAVWRFHDYWHAHRPDGIRKGMLDVLGWSQYSQADTEPLLVMPPTPLNTLIGHVKQKLDIKTVRLVGDRNQVCRRVLLMPGASGGRSHIMAVEKYRPDVILCGEANEWETPEYIRDARRQGQQVSLVVLGHIMSEAAGMEWFVNWLKPKVPGVSVRYIPSGNPFTYE